MTPMTVSVEAVAQDNPLPAPEPKISTPLSVIAWLSIAAAGLSLIIAAGLSLIVWSVAG
jgi:hypothetical protein